MDHQKWLEWRRNGIGSSDAAVIMGVSPWKNVQQLWEEKLYGKTDQLENYYMFRGKEMEEPARCEFERMMGISVFPKNIEHKQVNWMRASLDGIDLNGKIMVEIKCPGKEDHIVALNQKVPSKYFPQCQHQLMVTDLDTMFYFSFDGKNGTIVEVKRDQGYIDKLWEEEHKFWELKEKRISPEMDLDDDSDWKCAVTQWSKWKNILDEAEERKEYFKQELLKICKGKDSFGAGIRLTKSMIEGRLDTKKVMQDYPDIPWDSYKKDSFEKIVIKFI